MDAGKCPFVPNAGAQPAALPGRDDLLGEFRVALDRAKAGRTPKSLIPYGLRGVGKTVLLNRFTDEAANRGYRVAYIEADESGQFLHKLAGELRRILLSLDTGAKINEAAKRAIRVLKSFTLKAGFDGLSFEIGVDPERGEGDSGDLAMDLTSLLLAVGEAARAQDTAVLIAVDEVQYVAQSEFEALILALHRVTQKALPLLAVVTGLPQVLGLAGEAKSYAERLFEYREIGALSKADARLAIVEPAQAEGVVFEEPALERLYELTAGYPFFIQEWAYHTWVAAEASPITRAVVDRIEDAIIVRLDQSFFRVRYDRATNAERRYLRAMAELGAGPHSSSEVAAVLKLSLNQAAPTRDNLIKKGMIYSPEHGKIAFTVPLFDGFMRRVEPAAPVASRPSR